MENLTKIVSLSIVFFWEGEGLDVEDDKQVSVVLKEHSHAILICCKMLRNILWSGKNKE